jgi:hypothetical protein
MNLRNIALAVYLERCWQNDQWEFRQHITKRDWLHSIDGSWAVARFDRAWPTYWVAPHPAREVAA